MSLPDVPTQDEDGVSRRTLLRRGATGGMSLVLAGHLELLFGASAHAAHGGAGYGPLIPDPKGRLALPRGFKYELVAEAGVTQLDTGEFSPADPDGMAAFPRRDGKGTVLVLNHEISGAEANPVPKIEGFVYDPHVNGGTTTLVVEKNGKRVSQVVSLAGTLNNCAGGRTPWETWLTCEETEARRALPHGYVFEVDPYDQEANRNPKPLKALGRFPHESVTVDPDSGNVYQTEDASGPFGLFYRFTPPASALPLGKGSLRALADDAGTLEAMVARDGSGAVVSDLSQATQPGTTYAVTWLGVPDRTAATTSTRRQFPTSGTVTRSQKLEGMWYGDGGHYFVASYARLGTAAAPNTTVNPHEGQVWFFDEAKQTIELKLIFASTREDDDTDVDGPDNITVSPYGGVILAEDGNGAQHLVGSTAEGETFFLARNEDARQAEFCGPTFSRDDKTLFVSVQSPGPTFAITGPFKAQR